MVKKVLLLGSGFVAGPCAQYVIRQGHSLTIACRTLESAEAMCKGLSGSTPLALDVNDSTALSKAISKCDLVISLIPYIYHVEVIKAAIQHKVHVVTTSFISPAMLELDDACKKAGIVVMNEIGVDPGIDLLYASKIVNKIHGAGGKVISFIEMGAAFPAPECADNPLKYKFSWSPTGSLRALSNPAKFLRDGQIVEVDGANLLSHAKTYYVNETYPDNLVEYPNRDSTLLIKTLGIPEARTVYRATMRYKGFDSVVGFLQEVGMMSGEKVSWDEGKGTWLDVWARVLGCEADQGEILTKLESIPSFTADTSITEKLNLLGLLSPTPVKLELSPLETIATYLGSLPEFLYDETKGERDVMLLQIKIEAETSTGEKETHIATLEQYGVPGGNSAMALTVGIPCGVAVQAVFDGLISSPGVQGPYDEKICAVLREMIEREGINIQEEVIRG